MCPRCISRLVLPAGHEHCSQVHAPPSLQHICLLGLHASLSRLLGNSLSHGKGRRLCLDLSLFLQKGWPEDSLKEIPTTAPAVRATKHRGPFLLQCIFPERQVVHLWSPMKLSYPCAYSLNEGSSPFPISLHSA